MKLSKEVIIGIIALITLLVSIWGYKFLKGENILSSDKDYYVEYPHIDQLSKSAPVLINGFQVGVVLDIKLNGNANNAIIVHFSVSEDVNIPQGSTADIISTSIIGGKAIRLHLNGVCNGDDCVPSGSFLEGKTVGVLQSTFSPDDLNKYMNELGQGVDNLIDTLDKSLKESEMGGGIGKSIVELEETISNLKAATAEINMLVHSLNRSIPSIMNNINGIAGNLNQEEKSIDATLHNIQQITEDLKNANLQQVVSHADEVIVRSSSTIAALEETTNNLKALIQGINSGQGSLGQLINDKELYNNLNRSARNLELLLQDIRLNPRRYLNVSVFGGKGDNYTVPENDPAYQDKN